MTLFLSLHSTSSAKIWLGRNADIGKKNALRDQKSLRFPPKPTPNTRDLSFSASRRVYKLLKSSLGKSAFGLVSGSVDVGSHTLNFQMARNLRRRAKEERQLDDQGVDLGRARCNSLACLFAVREERRGSVPRASLRKPGIGGCTGEFWKPRSWGQDGRL